MCLSLFGSGLPESEAMHFIHLRSECHTVNLEDQGSSPPVNLEDQGSSPPVNLEDQGSSPPVNLEDQGSSPPVNLEDQGSSPPAFRNLRNLVHSTLPMSFGRDTKSRWSLLPGVYARGSKRSHPGGKCCDFTELVVTSRHYV